MYTDFYKLTGKPFQLTPDPDFYVDTKTHRKAMAYLTYGLAQAEGFIVVTGDIGAGKTTLVARLLQQNEDRRTLIGNIVTSQVDGSDLLRLAASAFGLPAEREDKSSLLARLESMLRTKHREGVRVVLIVDEAQNLPFDALEELRMLSNFQEGGQPLMQTILLGQPEFRARLAAAPNLEQLRQRTIASHHLEPMRADEVQNYVESRLNRCGWKNDPAFTDDAYREIYEWSGGVPRRVNNLSGRILLFGSLEGTHEITGDLVRDVVSDLEEDDAVPERHRALANQVMNNSQMGTESDALAERIESVSLRTDKHQKVLQQLLHLVTDLSQQVDEMAERLGQDAEA